MTLTGEIYQDPTFAGPPQTAAVDAKRSATNGEDDPGAIGGHLTASGRTLIRCFRRP
jgi:hypothetical protein